MDYYKILNIDKNATPEEIKKQFRSLSYKYHPDRNKDEGAINKMKEINEAYETLKDPQKKKIYDLGSNNPLEELFGNLFNNNTNVRFRRTNVNPIEELFNENVMFSNFMDNDINSNIEKKIEISFKDSYTGVNVPLVIKRKIVMGNNTNYEQEKIYIKINSGTDDGEILNIQDKGNFFNGQISDLRIHIKVLPHHNFERNGLNLIYYNSISFKESLCGFQKNITTITGNVFKIQSSNGNIIQNNDEKIILNKGFTRNGQCGNLIIRFKVEKPNNLTEEQIKILNTLL